MVLKFILLLNTTLMRFNNCGWNMMEYAFFNCLLVLEIYSLTFYCSLFLCYVRIYFGPAVNVSGRD